MELDSLVLNSMYYTVVNLIPYFINKDPEMRQKSGMS